jgi:hypothetical protein
MDRRCRAGDGRKHHQPGSAKAEVAQEFVGNVGRHEVGSIFRTVLLGK